MKTNKLPQSDDTDLQAAGSHIQRSYIGAQTSVAYELASNDNAYQPDTHTDGDAIHTPHMTSERLGYKKPRNKTMYASSASSMPSSSAASQSKTTQSPRAQPSLTKTKATPAKTSADIRQSLVDSTVLPQQPSTTDSAYIPERMFMNGLIKHTAIALAIIIPLAAFSAYAATPEAYAGMHSGFAPANQHTSAATQAVRPAAIMYNDSSRPMAVDSVDIEQYAGTWYEIGRLPMYFQRKCAGNVTATYTINNDSSIGVLNKCLGEDGSLISADGVARAVDDSGSKLKVTFLPSWLRWLPVGRADYWVLARDADYNTALVGTPDNKYLWLLARTPDISADTYAKYRQIAQQQGYDLNSFKLTTQSEQTVDLTP
ncbi:lipocalin family protein [Psychrobacter aestuarii]|uniref:Lipocalin/cytosolic fatty-acid binding domain-containing protein n=1 Tax=Psychrobacter aestuarii TaxID=556327 RepID=A0ABP3FPR2_9GAMM|nr:lipocalin family protein [Psychrobacter aestuarii]